MQFDLMPGNKFSSIQLRKNSDILSGNDAHTRTSYKLRNFMKHAIQHKYSVLTLIEWTRFYLLFIYFGINLFHAPQTFRHHVVIFYFFVLCGVAFACNDIPLFYLGDEHDTANIQ